VVPVSKPPGSGGDRGVQLQSRAGHAGGSCLHRSDHATTGHIDCDVPSAGTGTPQPRVSGVPARQPGRGYSLVLRG
jgi:hypothetical protein